MEQVANLACRTALSYRGVAHINFPVDLQESTGGERSKRARPGHTSDVFARGAEAPVRGDLQDELEAMAERLGAPIVKALLGKAAVPDDSSRPV